MREQARIGTRGQARMERPGRMSEMKANLRNRRLQEKRALARIMGLENIQEKKIAMGCCKQEKTTVLQQTAEGSCKLSKETTGNQMAAWAAQRMGS